MGRAYYIQPTFSGGAFDPMVQGRIDSERYATGLKQCENFIIHKFGSVSNRTGFSYLGGAKHNGYRCRLVPFIYSNDQAYVLEFGKQYIRFWNSDGTQLMNSSTPLELSTPYGVDDLRKLRFVQSADKVFIACEGYKPRVLSRDSPTSWSIATFKMKVEPFLAQNLDDDITITPSGIEGTVTLTASSNIFKAGHVGSMWRIDQNMSGGTVKLETTTSSGAASSCLLVLEPGTIITITTSGTSWTGTVVLEKSSATSDNPVYKMSGDARKAWEDAQAWTTVYSKKHDKSETELNVTYSVKAPASYRLRLVDLYEGTGSVTATMTLSNYILPLPETTKSVSHTPDQNSYCASIACGAGTEWHLITHGADWVGRIAVERSYDNGENWLQVRSYTHRANESNYNTYYKEPEQCLVRINVKELTAGTVEANLSVDPYVNVGYVRIKSYVSGTVVTAEVDTKQPIGNISSTDMWWEGAWSDAQGYPAAVCFYEDRLVFAGTKGSPRGVWMSKAGDYNNFATSSPTSEDDDSIQIVLTSRKMAMIHTLVPMRQSLMVFSEDGVSTIGYSESSLTPSSVTQRAESYFGAKDIAPLIVGAQCIYVQEVGGAVRDIGYDYVQDAYNGDEVSLFASHLVNTATPVEMAYQQEPDSVIWFVRDDGALLSCTYMREQKMIAWSKHETQGQFESVCVIPYTNNARVWAAVKREVNDSTVRYIERMTLRLPTTDPADQTYLDSAYTYDGTATDTLSIPHLAGCKVRVVLDGNLLPDYTVGSDGALTLERSGQKIVVGLGYTSKLETLNIETQGFVRQGVMQGHKVQITEVILRLLNSRGGKIGSDEEHLDEWQKRLKTDWLGQPLELFTGDAALVGNFTNETGGRMMLVQDVPMPFTLLAIMMGVRVSDG